MRKKILTKKIIRGVMLLWLLILVLHIFFSEKFFLLNISGSIPPHFFVMISFFFLIFEVLQKRKCLIFLILGIIIVPLGLSRGDFLVLKQTKKEDWRDTETLKIKVFNWNTYCWDQNKDKESFFNFLKKQESDIYLLQEYLHAREWNTPGWTDSGRYFSIYSKDPFFPLNYAEIENTRKLEEYFPGFYIYTEKQFVTISRYPITRSYCDPSEQYIMTDININGKTISFFNVHFLLHVEPENPFKLYFYRAIFARYKARKIALNNLKNDIGHIKNDYLIAGDFNSTKTMGLIHDLLKTNIDAAVYDNNIMPLTFEYKGLRLWRVDYVFINKNPKDIIISSFQNKSHENLSDHNPQYIELMIKKDNRDISYRKIITP